METPRAAASHVELCGALEKRGGWHQAWQLRRFFLTTSSLRYTKVSWRGTATNEVEAVPLESISRLELIDLATRPRPVVTTEESWTGAMFDAVIGGAIDGETSPSGGASASADAAREEGGADSDQLRVLRVRLARDTNQADLFLRAPHAIITRWHTSIERCVASRRSVLATAEVNGVVARAAKRSLAMHDDAATAALPALSGEAEAEATRPPPYAHVIALDVPSAEVRSGEAAVLGGSGGASSSGTSASKSTVVYRIVMTQQRVETADAVETALRRHIDEAAETAIDATPTSPLAIPTKVLMVPPFSPCTIREARQLSDDDSARNLAAGAVVEASSPTPGCAAARTATETTVLYRTYDDFSRLRDRLLEFCVRGGRPLDRGVARFLDCMVNSHFPAECTPGMGYDAEPWLVEHRRVYFEQMLHVLLACIVGREAGTARVRQVLDDFLDVVNFGSTSMSMRLLFDVSLRSTRTNAPLWNEIYLPSTFLLSGDTGAVDRDRAAAAATVAEQVQEQAALEVEAAAEEEAEAEAEAEAETETETATETVKEKEKEKGGEGDSLRTLRQRSSRIIIGQLPTREMLVDLIEGAGVIAVLSVNMPWELDEVDGRSAWFLHQKGLVQEKIEVVDMGDSGGMLALKRGVRFIEDQLARGARIDSLRATHRGAGGSIPFPASRVYVHCKAGKGRSVAMVMAWLMKNAHPVGSVTPLAAYEIVVAHRPHINPDTIWTHAKVKEAHEYYLSVVLKRPIDDAARKWIDTVVMGGVFSSSPYMRARDALCAVYGGPKKAKELKRECANKPLLTTGASSWREEEVGELRRAAHEQCAHVYELYLEHFAAIGAYTACTRHK